jgi:hypothetical protein
MLKQLKAKYELYDSVEEMLSSESISEILGRNVSQIQREIFKPSVGASDSLFEKIKVDDQPFILKRMTVLSDWLTLGSHDYRCRSVQLRKHGVLDKLQPSIDHAIIAACLDGGGYAMLMKNVSRDLINFGRPLMISEVKTLLDAFATIHATFWNTDDLHDPALGLSDLKTLIEAFWPTEHNPYLWDTTGREKDWNILFDFVDPDVRDALLTLMNDPAPLYSALAVYPSTLIHGDLKPNNFAILPETKQVVVFDWQLAGYASPFIDLHWFLTSFESATPFNSIEYYRQQLILRLDKQLNLEHWQSMLEVGYLAGVLRMGWIHAGTAHGGEKFPDSELHRTYLPSFNNIVRNGLKWL